MITALLIWGGGILGNFISGADPPLHVTAHLASPFNVCEGGTGWVFHRSIERLSTPRHDQESDEWAAETGGIPASGSYIAVQLQGAESHTVVVTGVRIEVTRRRKPPRGTHATTPGGCGGIVPSFFTASLDSDPVRVRAVAGQGTRGTVPPVPLPHVISGERPEVWFIQATTRRCDCEWVAHIDWVSNGERGTSTVDDHDHPFRTTATTNALEIQRRTQREWMPVDAPSLTTRQRTIGYTQSTTLSGWTSTKGGRVLLLAQRFPFDRPYRAVAKATVDPISKFQFIESPSLATRYRAALASDTRAASPPVSVFAGPLYRTRFKTIKIRRERGRAPAYREVGWLRVRIPGRFAAVAGPMPVFIYFATRHGTKRPDRLRLAIRVFLRRTSRTSWFTRFSFPVAKPPGLPRITKMLMCAPSTYDASGFGSPRPNPQCGRPLWVDS